MNTHLHILHLFPNTPDNKVNQVAQTRQENLLKELDEQGITDYSLIEGYYEPSNTKLAIHKGHRRIVQLAKEQGFENCIVGEDDLKFSCPTSYQYFLTQIPESYDIFSALVYSASMQGNRVMNGASGIMSLYSIHNRFYDFFLSMDINNHVDREAGLTAYKHEYYVCQPMCVEQRGGYSFNLRQNMWYDVYLENTKLYGVD